MKKIRNHVHKLKVKNSNSDLFCKNPVSTNKMLTDIPSDCARLREKILRENKNNFKDKR